MVQKQNALTDRDRAALDSYLLNQNADLAYLMSRERPTKADGEILRRMALRWLRADEVQTYLSERRKFFTTLFAPDVKEENVDEVSSERSNRSKEDVVRELNLLIDEETDSKKRSDLLMKLAELQRMKQEMDETEEERRDTFYIPLTYDRCREFFARILAVEFRWTEEQEDRAIELMANPPDTKDIPTRDQLDEQLRKEGVVL